MQIDKSTTYRAILCHALHEAGNGRGSEEALSQTHDVLATIARPDRPLSGSLAGLILRPADHGITMAQIGVALSKQQVPEFIEAMLCVPVNKLGSTVRAMRNSLAGWPAGEQERRLGVMIEAMVASTTFEVPARACEDVALKQTSSTTRSMRI